MHYLAHLVTLFVAITVVGNVQNMNYVQQCTMQRIHNMCIFRGCMLLNAYISVYEDSLADVLIRDGLNQFQDLTGLKRFQDGTYLYKPNLFYVKILTENT